MNQGSQDPLGDDPEASAFREAIEKARRLVALELDLAETRRRLAEDSLRIAEAQLALAEERIRDLEEKNDRLQRDLEAARRE